MTQCSAASEIARRACIVERSLVVLSESQVADLIEPAAVSEQLRLAFASCGCGGTALGQRIGISTAQDRGSMIIAPGLAPDIPAYTVKLHPRCKGDDPADHGVLLLHDLETGALLAVMGSTHLTAVRTGLTSAIAGDALANAEARTAAVIGAGRQGAFLLKSLLAVRAIEHVRVFDVHARRAAAFANRQSESLGVRVESAGSIEAAVRDTDVILTATWSREPFLQADMVRQGAHISAIGADEAGKQEIHHSLLTRGRIFADDARLVAQAKLVSRADVDAELGEVLAGRDAGRTSHDEITIFLGVGLPFQDVVAAWQVYERAMEGDVGTKLQLTRR